VRRGMATSDPIRGRSVALLLEIGERLVVAMQL
jgi:hypothetical protein